MFNFSNNYNFFRKKYQSAGGGPARQMTAAFVDTTVGIGTGSSWYEAYENTAVLLTAYTESIWAKWTSSTFPSNAIYIPKLLGYAGKPSYGYSGFEDIGVNICINPSGQVHFWSNRADGNNYASGSVKFPATGTHMADHQWHHLCQKREGNVYKGYIDGVFACSTTYGTETDKNVLYHMYIGRDFYNIGKMNAGFAEPAFWDVTLTDEEIASLAAGTDPTTIQTANLLDHWNLTTNETANLGSRTTNSLSAHAPELPKSTTDVPPISGGGSFTPAAFYANKKVFLFFK